MATEDEKIVLGSGKLYIDEFVTTIPTDVLLEVETNLLGYIQGGATLEYKPTFYEAEDDLGLVSKTILTKEDVLLKSGIMTWCGKTLAKLCATARVTEALGKRTVKIGGINNQDGKQYVIRFVHIDAVDGNIRVTIVGNNQAGFSFAFVKDKETIVDAEFKAMPFDAEGTKIIYEEDIPNPELGILTVTSIAGTTTGKTAIAVVPTLISGNSYMYKTAATVTLPILDALCDVAAGYTAWIYTTEITATTGNEIAIVEVDSAFKAVKAGQATVTSKV